MCKALSAPGMGVAAGCLPDSEGAWNKSRIWDVSMEAREALSVFTTAFATSSLKRCGHTSATHCLCNQSHAAVHETHLRTLCLLRNQQRHCIRPAMCACRQPPHPAKQGFPKSSL